MPKGIDRYVSENREATRRIDATFVEISSQRDKNINFLNNTITIPTTIQVYTRSLNDSLISGHPNGDKHGSGFGVAGDVRGDWSLVEDVEQSEDFTENGRNSVRNVLAGETTSSMDEMAVGDGTNTASHEDTSLQSKNKRKITHVYEGENTNESVGSSYFLFAEFGDQVSEYGIFDGNGNLLNRITTNSVNPGVEEELRVDIKFTINGSGLGDSKITNDGEESIANSLRSESSTIGVNKFLFGDDDTSPAKSDTALANQTFSKVAQRQKEPETLVAHVFFTDSEPSGLPKTVKEIGIEDNNGNLLWRAIIDSFDKTSDFSFQVSSGFRTK